MKKTLLVYLSVCILLINACTPQVTVTPVPVQATDPAPIIVTQPPIAVTPTVGDKPVVPNSYTNSIFGLSFQFPSSWFGPDEYISGQQLRVEVGSDVVYPYGNPPGQPSDVKNSYSVVIQLYKANQNPFWKDTYLSLQNLKDGESQSGTRSLIIRVRQLDLGRFKGFEYIATLSESAKTDNVYGRDVLLFDDQTNDLLTIDGQPNNVEVSNGTNWRTDYQKIDEANLTIFHKIVESISIK
jgi:hypothetical protein